ncbi:MAG: hypothetical protein QOG27_363, partial [Verrucomicrobiota bacterium]
MFRLPLLLLALLSFAATVRADGVSR